MIKYYYRKETPMVKTIQELKKEAYDCGRRSNIKGDPRYPSRDKDLINLVRLDLENAKTLVESWINGWNDEGFLR
jgi:hypothetical protein